MKLRPSISVFTLIFLLSTFLSAQGWQDFSPPGMHHIHNFRSFDYANNNFEIFVWNSSRGFSLNETFQYDSILATYRYFCDPIIGSTDVLLSEIQKAPGDPDFSVSVYVTGCFECFTEVFYDTTGQNSNLVLARVFDDFLCAGMYASAAIFAYNSQHIYFTFMDSIYYSPDGGQTVVGLSSPDPEAFSPDLTLLKIHPTETEIIFTTGYERSPSVPKLYKSTNAGQSWNSVLQVEATHIEFDPAHPQGVYVTSENGVFRSSDFGDSWRRSLDGEFHYLEVDKDQPEVLYAGNSRGELYRSIDRGETWQVYNNTFTDSRILGIHSIADNDTLIVAAFDGVYKVYDQAVGLTEEDRPVPVKFSLQQNYPNPFNPRTVINYEIDFNTRVKLTVYNALGQQIKKLVDERQTPGKYTVTFDMKDLPAGMYVYRLKTSRGTQSKKMTLVR